MENMMKSVEKTMEAATKAMMPEEMSKVAKKVVEDGRVQFDKMTVQTDEAVKIYNDAWKALSASADEVSRQVFDHAIANAHAAFDGMSEMLKCTSIGEIAETQNKFVTERTKVLGEQAKELQALNQSVTENAAKTGNDIARRAFDQFKTVA